LISLWDVAFLVGLSISTMRYTNTVQVGGILPSL
jgi:hypothetical protein